MQGLWPGQVADDGDVVVGHELARDPFVISNALDGSVPWRPDGATQRFRRLCARAGVNGVRLQDLRHANASMMLAAGVPSPAAADRLGHSVATLHKVYAPLQARWWARPAVVVGASVVAGVVVAAGRVDVGTRSADYDAAMTSSKQVEVLEWQ